MNKLPPLLEVMKSDKMRLSERFKTELRGRPIDIEIEAFFENEVLVIRTCINGGEEMSPPLTRKETAELCRQASAHAGERKLVERSLRASDALRKMADPGLVDSDSDQVAVSRGIRDLQ